jgi:hypothetical protein
MRWKHRWTLLTLLAARAARADEAGDARMKALEQQLEATQSSVAALKAEQRQLAAQLAQAQGLQSLSAEHEAARVARVRAVDALLAEAADAELVLMSGERPDAAIDRMSSEVASLRADAGARSGRLEYACYGSAGESLVSARQALDEADWLRARDHLTWAAQGLVGAREAAAGNPNRAAVGR